MNVSAMKKPLPQIQEEQRLSALYGLNLLYTPPEERFDRITRTVARFFKTPFAIITLADTDRIWFKSVYGLQGITETPRPASFDAYSIAQTAPLIVPDTSVDPRFTESPLVAGQTHIRFYAGYPLRAVDGSVIGTLCILDPAPRSFSAEDAATLADFAVWVENEANSVELREALAVRREIEQLLEESEERYRTVIAALAEGVILQDADGTIRACNASAERILGLSADQLMGRQSIDPRWQAVHEDGTPFPYEQQPAQITLTTGEPQRYVVMGIIKPDGRQTWVAVNSEPILQSGESRPRAVVSSYIDITTTIEAETVLRRQALTFEALHDGVIITDLDGTIVDWNHGAETMYGYTKAEVIGRSGRIIFDNDPQLHAEIMSMALKTGRWSDEVRFRHRNGTSGICEMVMIPLRNDRGEAIGLVSVNRDVTTRRLAEEERDRFFTLSLDLLCIMTIDRRLRRLNPAVTRLLGYVPDELIGQDLLNYVHADDQPMAAEQFARLTEGEPNVYCEMRMRTKDGGYCWLALTAASFLQDQLIYAAARDISGHKHIQAELALARDQALEASRLKSEFLANMSHEIRTPMNGVIGMTDLLSEQPLNDKQREMVHVIRTSGAALLAIINDILDFSKIEAGKLTLEMIDFQPRLVVSNAIDLLNTQAREKNLRIEATIDPLIPPTLNGDPIRVHQVLLNLINNAIKFTEEGSISINATLERSFPDSVLLRFSVRDTGIGMSEDISRQLFRPFTQADGSTTRRYGGTGLGLAISKRLVEMMNGQIEVESQEGQGSTFWFTVQLRRAEQPTPDVLDINSLKERRILLVDSGSEVLNLLNSHPVEASISQVSNASEVLPTMRHQALADSPFDLVIISDTINRDGDLAHAIKADLTVSDSRLLLIGEPPSQTGDEDFVAMVSRPVDAVTLIKTLITAVNNGDWKVSAKHWPPSELHLKAQSSFDAEPDESGRILLVEDNAVNQKLALLQLHRLGYTTVDAVASGPEALKALSERPYSIVLMDCQMPEMDGFETTRQIRTTEANTGKHVPIVALTANALEGDRQHCLAAGMDDYIAKPIDLRLLAQVMAHWIGDRPISEAVRALLNSTSESSPVGGPSLDMQTFDKLRKLIGDSDPEFMRRSINVFIESGQKMLKSLQSAVAEENLSEIFRLAHTLKSSSASYGALRFSGLCKILELAARAGTVDGAAAQLDQIEVEFENVKAELERNRDLTR